MQINENLEKVEQAIESMSHELIYSKETTLYIYVCLLMRKMSLNKAHAQQIGWSDIVNAYSTTRIRAFYKALDHMQEVDGLSFLFDPHIRSKESSKLEIILNAILPAMNMLYTIDRQVVYNFFKISNGLLKKQSRVRIEQTVEATNKNRKDKTEKEDYDEITLNDFFFELVFEMMDFNSGGSVYVFGPLDRNFLIETVYRNADKQLTLTAQIKDTLDYLITKILFYLFDADSTHIINENFLTHPLVEENSYDLKRFDYVISTSLAPIQKLDSKSYIMEDKYNRFSRSALVMAREFFHWAVIDTGLASLKENGTFFDFVPEGPLTSSGSANERRNLLESRVQTKVFQFNSPSLFHVRFPVLLATFEKSVEPVEKVFMANFFEFYKNKHIDDLTPSQKKEVKQAAVQNKELKKISQYVAIGEIKENNMSLSPSSYIFEMPEMTPEEKKLFDTLEKLPNKRPLDEIAEIFKGRTPMKEDKREAKRNYTPVKLIRVKAIRRNGTIDWASCEHLQLPEKNFEKYKQKKVKVGDILMPAIGLVERIGIVREIPREDKREQILIADSNVIVIRVNQEEYSQELLFNIFAGPYGRYFIKKISRGLGVMMINTQVLNKVKIPVLEQEKQEAFQKNLTEINEDIQSYRQKISELEGKKDALLEQIIRKG